MSFKFKKWSKYAMLFSLALPLSVGAFTGKVTAAESKEDAPADVHLDVDAFSSEKVTVVVELDEESVLQAKQQGKNKSKQSVEQERDAILAELDAAGVDYEVNQEYEVVFSGLSLRIPQNQLGQLISVPGVKAVYPNETYKLDSASVDVIDREAFSPEMHDSAPYIGSEEAWEAGYTGEGVTVAVLDTGVDYTHPDLAHAFGEYKGWDFVDNDADPQETNTGTADDLTMHGTHVAGTIAANGEIKGVAPDADLLAYRVLGPGGSGYTEDIIAAIERAVEDGADVMNLSLGNTLNNPDYATSIALDAAMADGVVAVTSNGNSGSANWTVGSPGTSREAISVGASQLPYNTFNAELSSSSGNTYPSAVVQGFPSEEALLALNEAEYEFVHVGLGSEEEFSQVDAEGKIALISRGELPYVTKAENAKQAGAVGAVVYNNVPGEQPLVPGMAVPTVTISQEDGQKLLAELEAGNPTLSFNVQYSRTVNETIADFSSRGPVMDTWMIKPDVVAPGVNITSTVPTHDPSNPHGYASMQGTSMASPHVAGAVALMLEANPDWNVDFVKAALMNTAERLVDPNGTVYPHNTQGAGSIRVLDAIQANTLVTDASHSFGIFTKQNGKEVHREKFTVHNLSDKRKKYSIKFTGHDGISVKSSNNLQVQPGKTQEINYRLQVDSNLEPGYYEGTFVISDGTNELEVPTIIFVQEPDYPLLNSMQLGISGNYLVGIVNLTKGAENFNLRIRDADSGELIGEVAHAENLPIGEYFFAWDMAIDGQPLGPGRYQINAYAQFEGEETEIQGGVLTIGSNQAENE